MLLRLIWSGCRGSNKQTSVWFKHNTKSGVFVKTTIPPSAPIVLLPAVKYFFATGLIWAAALLPSLSAQTIQWAHSFGSPSDDVPISAVVDADENILSFGYFRDTFDAEQGPGVTNLSAAPYADFYLQKTSTTGNFLWARDMDVPANNAANFFSAGQVGVNATGDVYVNYLSISDIGNEVFFTLFIKKFDPNGTLLWEKQLVLDNYWHPGVFPIDAAGNLYVFGAHGRAIDADPGPGTHILPKQVCGLSPYVIKLDPDGNFIWAIAFDCQNPADFGYPNTSLRFVGDALYLHGTYFGTFDFDPGPGKTMRNTEGALQHFVVQLDTAGQFKQSIPLLKDRSFAADTTNLFGQEFIFYNGQINAGIAAFGVDADQNLYTAGFYLDSLDLDPGPDTLQVKSKDQYDAFVQKIGADGQLKWAFSLGGTAYQDVVDIQIDADNHLYLTGRFADTLDFDPGPDTHWAMPSDSGDLFILKLDADARFIWLKTMDLDLGVSIPVSPSGNLYTAGSFQGSAVIETASGPVALNSKGKYDLFLQKLAQTSISVSPDLSSICPISVFPNPATDDLFVHWGDVASDVEVVLYTLQGSCLWHGSFTDMATAKLSMAHLIPGFYFLTIYKDGMRYSFKIAKQ